MCAQRSKSLLGAGALSLLVSLLLLAAIGSGQAPADQMAGMMNASMPADQTAKAFAFHNDMRKLWEDHIIWTRAVIVSVAAGLPDLDGNIGRLMQNQADIGNAVRPFYGDAAANKLTSLLKEHIAIAGELLIASKAGDSTKANDAKARWYVNADEIAAFLTSANPENWPLPVTKELMKMHLDTTMAEAVARLSGDWAGDVAAFEQVHLHILKMADALSLGIINQFPEAFANSDPRAAPEVKISIMDSQYQPREIEAMPGAKITWTNNGFRPHTITSDSTNSASGGPSSDTQFPRGLQPGGSFLWEVPADAAPGTIWYYHCRFHGDQGSGRSLGSGMSGSIRIR